MSFRPEVVNDCRSVLGECPMWDPATGELLHVDIGRRLLRRFDPKRGDDRMRTFDAPVAAIAPARAGGLILGVGRRVEVLRSWDAAAVPIARVPTGDRVNDGACDPAGRFLVGTMNMHRPAGGCGLYRLDPTAGGWSARPVVEDVGLSNGFDWSPDGRLLYYADTPTLRVDVLDYDVAKGQAGHRRPFADLAGSPGRPDGVTVDGEGGVWVAVVRGGQVRRYAPDGSLDVTYQLPVPWVTSLAFGGPDLDELYATTAHEPGRPMPQPGAGSIYRIRPGIRGRAPVAWAGPTEPAPADD